MSRFLKLYLIALSVFLVLDLLWLGVVARGFYRSQLGNLLRPEVNWSAALGFYAVFMAGLVVLAVQPAVGAGDPRRALLLGGLLGLVAYAAYDLTNLATLDGFPPILALVDMVWGTLLCGSVSLITFKAWGWIQ